LSRVATFAQTKGFSVDQLTRYGVRDGLDGIEIPYFDSDGKPYKRYRIRNGQRFLWSPGSAPLIPYGLQRPVPFDRFVVITEGESDCWALWRVGIPALGIPGASNATCLHASHLGNVIEALVVREPDKAGDAFPSRVAFRLRETGFRGRISVLSFAPYKDPREAYDAAPQAFGDQWSRVYASRVPISDDGRFISSAEFLDERDTTRAWVWEPWLQEGGSMLIAAQKKVGKSLMQLNLAQRVARGVPFLDRPVTQGRVAYVSLDEPKATTRERAHALGITRDDEIDWYFSRKGLPRDWAAWLREVLARQHYALLIVDTLAKLTGIEDINSYGDWNRVLRPLHALADEFGTAWCGSAHNRKDSEGGTNAVAGSIALTAAVDCTFVMHKGIGGVRYLESEGRDGNDLTPTLLRLDESLNLTLGPTREQAARMAEDSRVYDLLHDGLERTGEQIRDELGMRRAQVWEAIERLVRTGAFVRSPRGLYARPDVERIGKAGDGMGPKRKRDKARSGLLIEDCRFFIGHAGAERCQRCGVMWDEHA